MNPRAFIATPASEDTASGDLQAAGMPTYLTPLIGRNADRQRLRELLIDKGHRMVVITGSGGIGKTRLAVQVANDLQRHFRHGSRFLSFASVPSNADLDAAFAWHLGLPDVHEQSHRDVIRHRLQAREQLLVIDNVEHLEGIADLLAFLQASCPSLTTIVTSRSELGIYGEVLHRLDPLLVEESSSALPGSNPARLASSPAVQLFAERVRAVAPDFTVTDENASDVVAICRHLGGIPLALELTAPRMASTTPAALLDELQQNLDQVPSRLAHTLHRPMTLQDTMRLSYDMLSADEQHVFRMLSIMRGYWTVEDVLPLITPEIDEMDAIAIIDSLVSRSMVYSPSAADEEIRFTINPVLRHFGRNLLRTLNEERRIADRHANRMIELAEAAEPWFTGKHQEEWLVRIDALHEDFRLALSHLQADDRPVDALRLSTALWRYGYTRGHYRQLRSWITSSLEQVSGHDALRSRALNGIGFLTNMIGDPAGTRVAHEEALSLASRLKLDREIATARIGLADLDMDIDEIGSALRHLEIAANAYERMQDPRGLASVLTNRGNLQWHNGDLQRAFTTHEEARVLYAQANDTRGVAWSDTNTGRIASQQGRYYDAVPRLQSALEGYIAIGDAYGFAEISEALAGVAVGTGDLETASTLAGAAVTRRGSVGSPLKSPDLEEFQATLDAARRWHGHEEAFARGRVLEPDEAIAIARSMPVPDRPTDVDAPDLQQVAQEAFGITPREYQVLVMLGEGLTDQQIADRLGISKRTVQTHNAVVEQKLGATTRVTAVGAAHQAGILPQRWNRSETGHE